MKNIHVLPTDKPSRLFENVDCGLSLNDELEPNGIMCQNQNIYITNDGEIKEGDWVYDETSEELVYQVNVLPIPEEYPWQKITLTTDQDLINDGVQAIDDEFLEWFVKNPSCDEIEIDKNWNYPLDKSWEYKIIIPKEEQKQHLIDMMKADEELGLYEENTKCYCGHTTYCDCGPEEPKQECMITKIMQMDAKMAYDSLPKQETLEEAAEFKSHHSEEDFIRGGRWQQERMYSKEEVDKMFETLKLYSVKNVATITNVDLFISSWKREFKKK